MAPGYFLLAHCPEQYPLLRTVLSWLSVSLGKLLFITADVLCALVQCRIIAVEGRKYFSTSSQRKISQHTTNWLIGFCWLFNPVTATVSVRGNAESVLGLAVLGCLLCVLQERIFLSGFLFGLCIHLKLYPAYFYHFTRVDFWHNFAPHFYPIYLFEGVLSGAMATPSVYDPSLFPLRLLPSGFLAWFYDTAVLQRLYGLFKLVAFLPALILVPGLAFKLHRRPSMAWFAITFAFVAFNKVCTSQYFLWWLVLLPSALACVSIPRNEKAANPTFLQALGLSRDVVFFALPLLLLWVGGQAGWLLIAYFHEIHGGFWGRGLWLALWLASVLFLLINVYILLRLVGAVRPESAVYKPKVTDQLPAQ
ncbi:unnamed protein product [Dibothriocephalus latus]|uniref:GPI alpha-1,4-mannosyltransferase I, catalytic subunit n=1 Tax=Dibothriocephalus latus TaxID=60516 RepID=A0A3P6TU99_DIBLA|nr:unnamed protein product [Dibothriocephalus latus]